MKTKTLIIIIALCAITLTAIGVTVWAVFLREPEPTVLTPDYAPQKKEENAEFIGDGDESKLEQPKGGGAVSLTYSTIVNITLSTNEAELLFQNTTKSNQNIVLQIVIGDTVIAQSGTINPGFKIAKLSLLGTATLSEGTYNGKFNVLYYNQESGERAILNTEIPISITVEK